MNSEYAITGNEKLCVAIENISEAQNDVHKEHENGLGICTLYPKNLPNIPSAFSMKPLTSITKTEINAISSILIQMLIYLSPYFLNQFIAG